MLRQITFFIILLVGVPLLAYGAYTYHPALFEGLLMHYDENGVYDRDECWQQSEFWFHRVIDKDGKIKSIKKRVRDAFLRDQFVSQLGDIIQNEDFQMTVQWSCGWGRGLVEKYELTTDHLSYWAFEETGQKDQYGASILRESEETIVDIDRNSAIDIIHKLIIDYQCFVDGVKSEDSCSIHLSFRSKNYLLENDYDKKATPKADKIFSYLKSVLTKNVKEITGITNR